MTRSPPNPELQRTIAVCDADADAAAKPAESLTMQVGGTRYLV